VLFVLCDAEVAKSDWQACRRSCAHAPGGVKM